MGAVTLGSCCSPAGDRLSVCCANQPISPFRESTVWISAGKTDSGSNMCVTVYQRFWVLEVGGGAGGSI